MGLRRTSAEVVELAKGAGLKIPSVEVQGFESLSPHHFHFGLYTTLSRTCFTETPFFLAAS